MCSGVILRAWSTQRRVKALSVSAQRRNSAATLEGKAGAGGKRAALGLVRAAKAWVRTKIGVALGRSRGSDVRCVGSMKQLPRPHFPVL